MKQYSVTGMSCAACSARVEKAVLSVPGVTSCSVSLLTNSMGVEGTADEKEIIKAVVGAGYGASAKGKEKRTSDAEDLLKNVETPKLVKRLTVSAAILLVLMYFSMGHSMWNFPAPSVFDNPVFSGTFQMILAAAVMVVNGKFFTSGVKAALHGAPNMDTLVALGSAASFGYSLVELFIMITAQGAGDAETVMKYGMNLYFESAAMIPTLITVGKLLESVSKGRTTDALKNLIKIAPKTAVVIRDGDEVEIPASEVEVGDTFVVRTGGAIPVDGVIVSGTASLDEAALTGESVPADKEAGDRVFASSLNLSGFITCRAERVGEDTALSQIIKTVSDAAATKAPIARIADRVSAVFVPVVIAIAAVTLAVWLIVGRSFPFAIARAISVLVISCPCALGLATPVAIMVGSGVGARHGILFKTAESLETIGKISAVALDKTGTVTEGHPEVTDVIPFGADADELLSLASSLEKMSEHPLAKAVVEYASGIPSVAVKDFETRAGSGVRGTLEGGKVVLGGSLKYISSEIDVPIRALEESRRLSDGGKTPLLFARGSDLIGIIAVADKIKDDSKKAVGEFKALGVDVVMLTGDNERTAKKIAAEAGIESVVAGILPEEKADNVRRLKEGGRVAMVGDGINDAPSLAVADTGVAIGAGCDVAIDAADVVVMKSRLTDVTSAIRLGRKTLVNIKENLFWAFIYNAVCIPLAMGVLGVEMKPVYGAAAMALSSFFVCMNALRLNLAKIDDPSRDRPIKKKKNIKNTKEKSKMEKTIKIEGMMCPHCEARVKKALEAIEGVASANVSHERGDAVVALSSPVDDAVLKAAVEDAGYTVL